MAFDNTITVVGNVTRDPELRFTQGGMAVANFGIAWNKRKRAQLLRQRHHRVFARRHRQSSTLIRP